MYSTKLKRRPKKESIFPYAIDWVSSGKLFEWLGTGVRGVRVALQSIQYKLCKSHAFQPSVIDSVAYALYICCVRLIAFRKREIKE